MVYLEMTSGCESSQEPPDIPDTRKGWSTTDESDYGTEKDKINIGKDYQAVVQDWVPPEERHRERYIERSLLVWSPSTTISQHELEEYIRDSKVKYGYNSEQALGILFWHKHNLIKAQKDLANYKPFPVEWSVEDKVLFEQAFQFHGKSFRRIKQVMPHKSIASLVKYYYSWKKHRAGTSLMDSQAKKLQIGRQKYGYFEGSTTSILNYHSKEKSSTTDTSITSAEPSNDTVDPEGTDVCPRFPKGMYFNHDDLVKMATGTNVDEFLKSIDTEIVSYKKVVQNNKQLLSTLKQKLKDRSSIEGCKTQPDINSGINSNWSDKERMLGAQCIRKLGKNFKDVADIIGTKNEFHVEEFYNNYREEYELDSTFDGFEEISRSTLTNEVEMNKTKIGEESS